MATSTRPSRRERVEAKCRAERRNQILTTIGIGRNQRADGMGSPRVRRDGRIALQDFEGSTTVAAFFASRCTVCIHELPEFAAVSRQIGDRVDFAAHDGDPFACGTSPSTSSTAAHLEPTWRATGAPVRSRPLRSFRQQGSVG